MFEVSERIGKISGIEKPYFFLTPMIPVWPLNLFCELLEKNALPKYYYEGGQRPTKLPVEANPVK
jgi:hypothetical protein